MKIFFDNFDSIIEDLVDKNLYLPYRGIKAPPEIFDKIKKYQAYKIKNTLDNPLCLMSMPYVNQKQTLMGVISKIDFLSNHFGVSIGAITQLVCTDNDFKQNYMAGIAMLRDFMNRDTKYLEIKYLSANVPVENIGLIRAFENWGFQYTEGFINMVNQTECQQIPEKYLEHIFIRNAENDDFHKIEKAYNQSTFPSRFVTETGFDSNHAMALYPKRFREIVEKDIGQVVVAEINGEFAGAIIVAIDKELYKHTGLMLNLRSGMGLIVNPKFRDCMVGTALVNYRQKLYREMGVKWVSLGTNISNRPMIKCLEKLGFTYGCQELTMANWIR